MTFFRKRAIFALLITFATTSTALAQRTTPTRRASQTTSSTVATPAPAPAPAVTPTSAATDTTVVSEPEDPRGPRDHTYAFGPGFTGSRFRTSDGDRMGMAGPSLVFDYTVGRRFGFGVHGGITFPLHGRLNDGNTSGGVNLNQMYDKRLSFDGMFLFIYRMRPTANLDLVFGGGLHFHTLRLVAEAYNPVELISGGLGGLVRAERRFADHFFYAGEMTAAFDPIDFVRHKNRAVFVAPITLAFTVGVRR